LRFTPRYARVSHSRLWCYYNITDTNDGSTGVTAKYWFSSWAHAHKASKQNSQYSQCTVPAMRACLQCCQHINIGLEWTPVEHSTSGGRVPPVSHLSVFQHSDDDLPT